MGLNLRTVLMSYQYPSDLYILSQIGLPIEEVVFARIRAPRGLKLANVAQELSRFSSHSAGVPRPWPPSRRGGLGAPTRRGGGGGRVVID